MNVNEAIKAAQALDRLAVLKQLELLDTPAEESFDRLTWLASQITNSPISLVSLVDVNRQFFKSQVGLPEPLAAIRQTPLSHSFCMHVVANSAPLVVEDARKHPILKDNLAIPDLGVIGYLGIPLITKDGTALGSFCIIDTFPRVWTEREIKIMHRLASMVMTEIELRAQIKARYHAEEILQQYTDALEAKVAKRTQELQNVHEQLLETDQLKSKFIDDLSHELRTPITNIGLYLDLLHRCEQENRNKYETVLREQSDKLISLLDGILSFSNMQKRLERPNLTFIDLNAVITDVIFTFQTKMQKQHLNFSFTSSSERAKIWGDVNQLNQVVTELLKNAFSYTKAGFVHMSTYHTENNDFIHLRVEDSGMGMDSEELTHCFKRFYRGKRVGQLNIVPGAGLGLAQVQDIVTFHKGRIEVESEVNKGTAISIYFPALTSNGCNGN